MCLTKRKEDVTLNEIITLISNVGFPIACCVALGWYVKDINDSYKSHVAVMTEALNQNTLVLTKLYERVENIERG